MRKSLKVPTREAAKLLLVEYQLREAKNIHNSSLLNIKKNILEFFKEFTDNNKFDSKKTILWFEYAIKNFAAYFQRHKILNVHQITEADIQRFHNEKKEQTKWGANSILRAMKVMLKYAAAKGYVASNAAKNVKFCKVPQKIFRDLSFVEVERFLDTAKKYSPLVMYPFIAAAYYTGMRRGELVYLEWIDIDFENNIIHVKTKPENIIKDRQERSLPLNRKLKHILLAVPKRSRFVFTTSAGNPLSYNLSMRFGRIVKLAGMKNVNTKTLRETFGSHLIKRGASIYVVSKYLGHSSVDITTKHYAYMDIKATQELIDKL